MRSGRLHQITVFLLLLIWLFAVGRPVMAREVPFSTLRQDVVVTFGDSGAVTITETIRYKLHDDLRDLVFNIPFRKNQTIEIKRIAVADTITKIDQALFVETVLAESTHNRARAMTYHLTEKENYLDIHLHLFLKAGFERTISLSYTITPAVVQHSDANLFYHRFFHRTPGSRIDQVSLTLRFPQSLSTDQVWLLPSSLTVFSQAWSDDSEIQLTAEHLEMDHTLVLTCLMPVDSLSGAPEAQTMLTAEQLQQHAVQQDEALHQDKAIRNTAYGAIFFLIGLAALLFLAVYWFYDREGAYPDKQRYLRDVPHACPPVVLSLLVRRKRPAKLILTTLLHLVGQSYLRLEGTSFIRLEDNPETGRLSPSECYLLQWFFDDLAIDRTLSISQIRRYARHEETAATFQRRFSAWRMLLDGELSEQGLLDRTKTFKGRLAACVTALAYALLAILLTVFLQTGIALLLLIPTVGFLLYSVVLRRLTNRGRERYAEGHALARYLRKISHLPPFPVAEQQNQLLPYAMALGLIHPYLTALPDIWSKQPVQEQLAAYGISKQKKQPLKEQIGQLSADLRVLESMLASSLLLSERIHH